MRQPAFQVEKFKPKRAIQSAKLEDWIGVKTRLPVDLHKRAFTVAQREGVALEYVIRKMVESCLPGWEEALDSRNPKPSVPPTR